MERGGWVSIMYDVEVLVVWREEQRNVMVRSDGGVQGRYCAADVAVKMWRWEGRDEL